MSKSRFDREILTPEQQRQISKYQQNYENAKSQKEKDSWHAMAEQIRRSAGYSGDVSGDRYIPIDTYKPPTVPTINQYESRWGSELDGALNSIKNTPAYNSPYDSKINSIISDLQSRPDYVSPYQDLINKTMNDIVNRPDFSYDPEKDEAYQAYKKRALRLGDQAFHNTLGSVSAQTGGRLSSWGASMSSEARNNYHIQAELAQTQYEDRAYSKYQSEIGMKYQEMSMLQGLDQMEFNKYQASYNNQLNLLGSLQSLDQQKYMQYRDSIQDKKDYAGFIMQLDDRDFRNYQFMVDNTWKTFQAETINFKNELQFKQIEFNKALDRTNMLGYVNNQDSLTLGVPVGTLSQEARQRIENMQNYIEQQNYQFEGFKKTQLQQFEFEKEMIRIKNNYAVTQDEYQYNHDMKRLQQEFQSEFSSLSTTNSSGNGIVDVARTGIGGKYVYGAVGIRQADCTGFVQEVYKRNGIDIKSIIGQRFYTGNADLLVKSGKFIALNPKDAQPGDIMWRRSGNSGHAAIYAGNGKVIEASGEKTGIKEGPAFNRYKGREFMKAYRYIG